MDKTAQKAISLILAGTSSTMARYTLAIEVKLEGIW